MTKSDHRVEELEREVSRLADNVRDLEGQRDALLRDARNRHDTQVPDQHSWIGRLILLALTAATGSAAYFMFRGEDFSFAQLTALGSDVAALDTDNWLVACVLCIGAAIIFYVAHRRLMFGVAAMTALYGTHWAYFADQPAALNVTDQQYFWISTTLLTGAYAMLAYLSVHECRRAPKGRRRWAIFALANSVAFFATVWFSIESAQPDRIWQFRLFFAVLLTAMAALAETQGPYRNPVFQLYVAKSVLMINLALAAVLNEQWFALMLSFECACLAMTYRQSGFVLFKLINLVVLIGAVVYGVRISAVGAGGDVVNAWITSAALAFMLLSTAGLYTHAIRERPATSRKTSAHWSFADTALDIDVARLSVLHAAGATLILVTGVLLNFSENSLLPFSLAGAAVALFVLGVLSRTPSVEFAGVLVLACAQAAYGYSLVMDVDSTMDPITARWLVAALTGVSLIFAWRWDHTVRSDETAGALEYASSIAAPYIAAGLMIAALTLETLIADYAGAVQHATALGCLLVFRRWRSGGMRIVSVTLMLTGAITFARMHAWPSLTAEGTAFYWTWFATALIAPVLAERVLAHQYGVDRRPGADAARTILVVTACLTGLVGLYCGAPETQRAWWWLAMTGGAAICAIAFREGRYRWSGMIALVAAAVLAGSRYADDTAPISLFPFVATSIAVSGILIMSWAASIRGNWGDYRHRGTPRDDG